MTGGEPLLRRQLELTWWQRSPRSLACAIWRSRQTVSSFPSPPRALRDAGLRRVSFSLDSLDSENFKKITGRDGLPEVLESIELAQQLGLNPVKVNAVVIRGYQRSRGGRACEFACARDFTMRFIEFMPLDSGRAWHRELVVPGREILERLQKRFDLKPLGAGQSEAKPRAAGRCRGGRGEIGIIAPVSEPFCGHCDRLRLTADGKFRTCLFSTRGTRCDAVTSWRRVGRDDSRFFARRG